MLYKFLSKIFPTRHLTITPQRIVFIRPCCIGDVVMATGALTVLHETYPDAHITCAVGSWSARAIQHHPAIDAILETGDGDMPVRSPQDFTHFVTQLRSGQFDLAVSLVRSPLMSLALWMSGIPYRAGLDSLGRGFGYNIRVTIDPADTMHEGAIYLKVISQLAGKPVHTYANLPVLDTAWVSLQQKIALDDRYFVVHPGGGSNPGMQMDSKRYPIELLAQILNHVADTISAQVIIIGGPNDSNLVNALGTQLTVSYITATGHLTFAEIGALAESAICYIGNDTGLTHLASASGAKTVMMMGPSDPKHYAPFTDYHLALWKPIAIHSGGVASADTSNWDWYRDGFGVDDAVEQILKFVR